MAQVKTKRVLIHEVVEQGIIPRGQIVHAAYDDEAQAWAAYDRLLRERPALATPGVLGVRARYLEVLEEVGTVDDSSSVETAASRSAKPAEGAAP